MSSTPAEKLKTHPRTRPPRQVSRDDVATRAGVSHGTVSNVLNHPELVSEGMRVRVEAAIADLGFVRDESARHLRAGYSNTIGLLLLDAWNPGFIEFARGVEERTPAEQWTILMSNSARDTTREQRYLREYAGRRVAGLIVVPNDRDHDRGHEIFHGVIPMVIVDRPEDGPTTLSVSVDDYTGGTLIAQHLVGLGHRRIVFAGDPDAALPVRARFDGLRDHLDKHWHATNEKVELEVMTAPLTVEGGLSVGTAIAHRKPSHRPTAVATAVDLVAFGVLQSLTAAGVRVPQDLSLAGYDDIPFSSQLFLPLTTVARPHRQMGLKAASLLLQVISGIEPEHRHIRLQPELVVRASTAEPPQR